jgi:3',5'-cyclic AMP phosphodiesterase CpdA
MNRRNFLRNSSVLTVGTGLLQDTSQVAPEPASNLTVVFLSDVHVQPGDVSEAGMRRAFRQINAAKQKPRFIINGGDAVMDAMAADKQKTAAQWAVWNKVLAEENRLPVYHVIGNHDIWGWQVKDEAIKSDPLYDKAWVLKQHAMPARYYSFENGGWKFIVLDSTMQDGGGYIARFDETQFAWLESELKKSSPDQHICIVSHIPVVSFCAAMFFDDQLPNGDWKLLRVLLHVDARRVIKLFEGFKNIRCCLSGHIHLQDAVDYKGIQYFCNGAISGNWWAGPFKGFDPAYALFTFGKDGSVRRSIISY